MIDIRRVFLYTDLMITLARQIQRKLKKYDEEMIKLKIKHLKNSVFYSDLHKLDEKIQEMHKLVDNNK